MTYKYRAIGDEFTLTEDKEYIAVRFKEPAPHSTRASVATKPELGSFSSRFEIPGEKFTIFPVAQNAESSNIRFNAAMEVMDRNHEVTRVTPVFKVGDSRALATDRLSIGFKSYIKNGTEILARYECQISDEFGNNEYLVQLKETVDPFKVTEQLDTLSEIEYAQPDFVTISKHIIHKPISSQIKRTDSFTYQQYAIEITKAKGTLKYFCSKTALNAVRAIDLHLSH